MIVGDIGPGWVALLAPVLNLVAIALIYRITGKTKTQLEGVETQVDEAKGELKHDLKNGISDRIEGIHARLDNEVLPRLDRKKRAIQELREDVTQLDSNIHTLAQHVKKDQTA